MRMIDADALINDLKEHKIPFNADINEAIIVAPTVDAIKVVRCKDCIYQAECAFTEWLGRNGNGFCSCGEKINEVEE